MNKGYYVKIFYLMRLYSVLALLFLYSKAIASDIEVLEKYHVRGISSFFDNRFEDALDDFNRVLEESPYLNQDEAWLIGSALWGRALCNACLDQAAASHRDLALFDEVLLAIKPCTCANTSKAQKPTPPIVRYQNPNERITPRECLDRVQGTVAKLEELLATYFTRGTDVYKRFMDRVEVLAKEADDCCQEEGLPSTRWTICLYRLIEILQSWKKGVPANPYSYPYSY